DRSPAPGSPTLPSCAGRKVLLDSIVGPSIQPDSILLVTVLPESWYFNCSSAGTAHGTLVRLRANATVTSTVPVTSARTTPVTPICGSPAYGPVPAVPEVRFLPLRLHLSALREGSP